VGVVSETLFDGWEPEVREPRPSEDMSLSPGLRLTLRQAEMVTNGVHPLTRGPLHPLASKHRDADAPKDDPFTCGSCYFRNSADYHNRSYAKCWLPGPKTGQEIKYGAVTVTVGYPRVTHGAASDVRAWWPACPDYSPGDSLSPDAARSIPGGVA
jgi:hypothetical protein